MLDLHHAEVGDTWPELVTEPVSRLMLALYFGASGDHNPIHVDSDFARAAGRPDVFAHGMLSMAWLGRVLTDQVPQGALREFGVRFTAITQVGETLTCSAVVTERFERDGETCLRLALTSRNAAGQVKLSGDAVVRCARGNVALPLSSVPAGDGRPRPAWGRS